MGPQDSCYESQRTPLPQHCSSLFYVISHKSMVLSWGMFVLHRVTLMRILVDPINIYYVLASKGDLVLKASWSEVSLPHSWMATDHGSKTMASSQTQGLDHSPQWCPRKESCIPNLEGHMANCAMVLSQNRATTRGPDWHPPSLSLERAGVTTNTNRAVWTGLEPKFCHSEMLLYSGKWMMLI